MASKQRYVDFLPSKWYTKSQACTCESIRINEHVLKFEFYLLLCTQEGGGRKSSQEDIFTVQEPPRKSLIFLPLKSTHSNEYPPFEDLINSTECQI
ncbi:hypothetical protein KUTeg_021372 [Tegillarca granosa]|uniref:Uncharacterized protein n=1 Tax=Tegillarca granosa TaxID=220873 RepID=A0ABQ9EG22_TEGGR|nr:hypothetical protein KUTeg_021372 [Tegillarca granosa]